MKRRGKSLRRFFVATVFGLVLSFGLTVGTCYLGGDHACQNLIWPAVMVLGTGFEGQLLAAAATFLAIATVLTIASWFALEKWGPLRADSAS